jgi:hypothetical protein
MSSNHHPVPAQPMTQPSPQYQISRSGGDTCATLLQMAAMGAVVGASAAAGANILRVQRDEIGAGEAIADTGRAAAAAAAATAVAGAAASAVASQGLGRLAVLLATGTAVMYGLQRSRQVAES